MAHQVNMHVCIDQPRHYCTAAGINDDRIFGYHRVVAISNSGDHTVFNHNHAVVDTLALVTIQGLNPAWRFETDDKGWWLRAIPSTTWLPTGVDVPFERGGPWRMLLIYSSVLLTSCSLWVGFTRRRVLQTLFIVLATNGVVLAGFGIAQRLLGNGKIFWFYDSPNSSYFSSFIYKNHGGTYLVLALAVTCGLAAWYYLRGLRRMEKSNPAGLFAFFATCTAIAILISYARGATITMLAFLIKACVAALKKYPEMNSSLEGDNLVLKQYWHIGFAADTPNGLVVPVIRDADRKGVLELARETGALAAKAREGKLSPVEMQGGTFSISSLGGIGGTSFTPIINAPEVAILGVSRSAMKPVWNEDTQSFEPRLMLPLSLSYDHRVIDGAAGARFNAYLAQVLADFRRVLL